MKYALRVFLFLLIFSSGYTSTTQGQDKYLNFSTTNQQQTGVAILAYNRPYYLAELIKSLEKNKESQTLPFFFFLDGGDKEMQNKNIELIKASTLANKHIIKRPTNYGLVKNHIDSKRFMFDVARFESAIIMEEDLIVTEHYLETLLNFYHWSKRNYTNVATVQLWITSCDMTLLEKQKAYNKVIEVSRFPSLVTYCMSRQSWNAIKRHMYNYEKLFLNPTLNNKEYNRFRSKPRSPATRRWVRELLTNNLSDPLLKTKGKNKHTLKIRSHPPLNKLKITHQDTFTALLLNKAGYIRLQTVVNRCINIGEITTVEGNPSVLPTTFRTMTNDDIDAPSPPKVFELTF